MAKTAREPCLTLTDLSRESKIALSTLRSWSEKVSLPDQEPLKMFDRRSNKKYYKRSQLLNWLSECRKEFSK